MSEIHNYKTIFTSQVRDVDIEPLSLSLCQAQRRKVIKKEKKTNYLGLYTYWCWHSDITHTCVYVYIHTHTRHYYEEEKKENKKNITDKWVLWLKHNNFFLVVIICTNVIFHVFSRQHTLIWSKLSFYQLTVW